MKIVKFVCKKCGNTWLGFTDEPNIKNGYALEVICTECRLELPGDNNQMDFNEAKQLLKESIDEAETQGDILRIWVEKIYQKGKEDSSLNSVNDRCDRGGYDAQMYS